MAELGGFSSALRLALCDGNDVHKFEPILSGLAKGAHKTLDMFNEALNKAQMRVIIYMSRFKTQKASPNMTSYCIR